MFTMKSFWLKLRKISIRRSERCLSIHQLDHWPPSELTTIGLLIHIVENFIMWQKPNSYCVISVKIVYVREMPNGTILITKVSTDLSAVLCQPQARLESADVQITNLGSYSDTQMLPHWRDNSSVGLIIKRKFFVVAGTLQTEIGLHL